jgi:hypothetical protein
MLQAAIYAMQVSAEAGEREDCDYFGGISAAESILEKGVGCDGPVVLVCHPKDPDYSCSATWLNPKLFEPVTEIREFSPLDAMVYLSMLGTKEFQLRHLYDRE